MARSAPYLAVLVALVLAVTGCGSAVAGQAAPHRALAPSVEPGPSVAPAPSVDLAAARAGVARASAWWDPHRGWYDQYLPATGHTRRATLWGIVHLYGAYNAIAIADPSRANVAAARRFGIGAERYWNPTCGPCLATAARLPDTSTANAPKARAPKKPSAASSATSPAASGTSSKPPHPLTGTPPSPSNS